MTENVKTLVMVLLFLGAAPARAADEEVLTWKDCVREAKAHHPDLRSAEEALRQAEADRAVTKSALLPQLTSGLSARTADTETGSRTETYSYDLSGSQLLFDGSRTNYQVARAAARAESARSEYGASSSRIRLRLRSAFVGLLEAQELLGLTEGIVRRRKQSLELVRMRYEGGREHRGSLLTSRANLAQAEFEVAQAGRNMAAARRRLLKELGREKPAPVSVEGDFTIKHPERHKPDLAALAERTPFLEKLASEKTAAGFSLKSTRAEFFPRVSATAGAGRSSPDWPPEKDEWAAGISLSFPLFEGGERWKKVSGAKAALRQAEAEERSGRDGIILALEESWTELQDAADLVEVRKKFLEAAEERARIAQEQYSTGLISFDNWIIIEDDLVRARKNFLSARAEALIAEAAWIQAKGGTLDYEE